MLVYFPLNKATHCRLKKMYFSLQLYHTVAFYLLGCSERELSCSDESHPENCEFLTLIFSVVCRFPSTFTNALICYYQFPSRCSDVSHQLSL